MPLPTMQPLVPQQVLAAETVADLLQLGHEALDSLADAVYGFRASPLLPTSSEVQAALVAAQEAQHLAATPGQRLRRLPPTIRSAGPWMAGALPQPLGLAGAPKPPPVLVRDRSLTPAGTGPVHSVHAPGMHEGVAWVDVPEDAPSISTQPLDASTRPRVGIADLAQPLGYPAPVQLAAAALWCRATADALEALQTGAGARRRATGEASAYRAYADQAEALLPAAGGQWLADLRDVLDVATRPTPAAPTYQPLTLRPTS